MTVQSVHGDRLDSSLLKNYFKSLVNHFFKILPIREQGDASLPVYIRGLQIELLGCKDYIPVLTDEPCYLTLLGILQYLIDNPECSLPDVRREVFRAISICNKLKAMYGSEV